MTNEDAIKKINLLKMVAVKKGTDTEKAVDMAIEALKAEQPKKGEWIIDEYGIHHCPFCKAINETVYQNFCPNCGADMRMDGEKE